MATILNPSGTVSAVYNTEGRAIDSITAAGNYYTASEWPVAGPPAYASSGSDADATAVTVYVQHTVLLVNASAYAAGTGLYNDGTYIHSGGAVIPGILLPSPNAGDVVEIHNISPGTSVNVYFPVGATLDGGTAGPVSPGTYRYIGSNAWVTV